MTRDPRPRIDRPIHPLVLLADDQHQEQVLGNLGWAKRGNIQVIMTHILASLTPTVSQRYNLFAREGLDFGLKRRLNFVP